MQLTKKKIIISLLGITLFVNCSVVIAQSNEASDDIISTNESNFIDSTKREYKHYPQIATLASALVPGLGQIYNKKYWKTPIIWGLGISLYAYYEFNNTYYHQLKSAQEEINDEVSISNPILNDWTEEAIINGKEQYLRRRNFALLYMGLLYVGNIVDALVDAHMFEYDVNQNLSLNWSPTIMPPDPINYNASTLGINVQLKF